MPDGVLLSDQEVEQCLRNQGLNFLPGPRPSSWVIPVFDARTGIGIHVFLENGQGNQNFLTVFAPVLEAQGSRNLVGKALCILNGFLSLATFVLTEGGNVVVNASVLRRRDCFDCVMLRHAIGAVVNAIEFSRPILQGCLATQNFDVERAFCTRIAQMTGRNP